MSEILDEFLETKRKLELVEEKIKEIDILSETKNRNSMCDINDTVKRTKNTSCVFESYLEVDPRRDPLVKERNELKYVLDKLRIELRLDDRGNQRICTGSYALLRFGARDILIHITNENLAIPNIHHYSHKSQFANSVFGKVKKEFVRVNLENDVVLTGFVKDIYRRCNDGNLDEDIYMKQIRPENKVKLELINGEFYEIKLITNGTPDSAKGIYRAESQVGKLLIGKKLYEKVHLGTSIQGDRIAYIVEIN